MEPKRTASEQMAFRIEPPLATNWAAFVADSLIPNRAHHACAMLMYLGAAAGQRDAVQRLYARFQRTGNLQLPALSSADQPVSPQERELLEAYRHASEDARDEAIANLQDERVSASRKHDSDGTPDHRAG